MKNRPPTLNKGAHEAIRNGQQETTIIQVLAVKCRLAVKHDCRRHEGRKLVPGRNVSHGINDNPHKVLKQALDIKFLPLAFETLGAINADVVHFLDTLGTRLRSM